MRFDAASVAWHFAQSRWRLNFREPAALQDWQAQRLKRFLREVLPRAPRYKGWTYPNLDELPLMNKAVMMADFHACNTRGVRLEQALAVARQAELSRDFAPQLGDLTVGLSSGTSGHQGVFLVSHAERLRWAGTVFARALPQPLLEQVLRPWLPPLRVSFFLRANSNLYSTLRGRRIDFRFHDLLLAPQTHLETVNAFAPDVLVGPPALLLALCEATQQGTLKIRPRHVISVADVLEDADKARITQCFGVMPHQLYQATEGFLGWTCEQGGLHLNESFVHIEPQWLDSARTRFQPIVTDFTRETQLVVRYQLNDILHLAPQPCPCGRAERTLSAIEGRSDEVLWLPQCQTGRATPIFADALRRVMLLCAPNLREYRITQDGMHLRLALQWEAGAHAPQPLEHAIMHGFKKLWQQQGVQAPHIVFEPWVSPDPAAKRRRIRRQQLPEGLTCTF